MELRTNRDLIAGIAEAFKRRHCRKGLPNLAADFYDAQSGWFRYQNSDPKAKYEQLLALPDSATEEQVVAIVGSNVWTQNLCSHCGRDVEVTVLLGEEPDYDSYTAWICPECLREALRLVTVGEILAIYTEK